MEDAKLLSILKKWFKYEKGQLIRLTRPANCVHIGDVAGWIRGDGYAHIKIKSRNYKAHRLIFLLHHGYLPEFIDHINGMRSDNRIENLRDATKSENCRNSQISKNNKSGFNGVGWMKALSKYRADISSGGKKIYLGVHAKLSDAVKARIDAEEKYGYHVNHGRDPIANGPEA